MKLLEAYARLQRLHRPVFATSEATAALDLAPTATSMALGHLDQDGRVVGLRKGLWALPENLGGWVDLLDVLPDPDAPLPESRLPMDRSRRSRRDRADTACDRRRVPRPGR